MNKFELVRKTIIKNACDYKNILDAGCRDCALKPYVIDIIKDYKGVDLFQNKDKSVDYVCNLEDGLDISDKSFDCVVALDLVEHLNDFQGGMDELLRVTNKDLIVMLPNISHIFFRLKFLCTGEIGKKYDLKYGMGEDRHRWVTIFKQANEYMNEYAHYKNLKLETIYYTEGKKNKIIEKIGKFFHISPACYVWSQLYILKK